LFCCPGIPDIWKLCLIYPEYKFFTGCAVAEMEILIHSGHRDALDNLLDKEEPAPEEKD